MMQDSTGIMVVISIILISLSYFFTRRSKLKKLPPGPTGIPIFGYFPYLDRTLHLTVENLGKNYGKIFGFYIGPKYVVVCNDWESKKEVFGHMAAQGRPPRLFHAVPNGLGMSSSNGNEWLEQRKFFKKTMKDIGLGSPMWEQMLQGEVNEIVQFLQSRNGKPISLDELFSSSFVNSVMALIFGRRMPFNHPSMTFLTECMEQMMIAFDPQALSLYMPTLNAFLTMLGRAGSKRASNKVQEFYAFVQNAVDNELQKIDSSDMTFVKIYNEAVENNRKLNLNNSFTETSLYANTASILIGGSHTSKSISIWLLIGMAQFPDVQSKIQKELDSVLGREGSIKWAERSRIPYTFASILEGLRWNPGASVNPYRMTSEDIEVLGYYIPKGTYITSNNLAIHHDPKFWPNPGKFDPERFLVDDGKHVNPKLESYSPFSYGKRNCPGEHIALVGILQYFTGLLQNFTILPEDGKDMKYEFQVGLAHKPLNVKLRFVPRE